MTIVCNCAFALTRKKAQDFEPLREVINIEILKSILLGILS